MDMYELMLGDCLEKMGLVRDGSVHMILANGYQDNQPILFSCGKRDIGRLSY